MLTALYLSAVGLEQNTWGRGAVLIPEMGERVALATYLDRLVALIGQGSRGGGSEVKPCVHGNILTRLHLLTRRSAEVRIPE